ncbi:MAG: phosphonate C-P lyase system protein PhnH [Pseudomonadota bacterium]
MTGPAQPDQTPPPDIVEPRLQLARGRWRAETFRAVLDAVARPGTPQRIAASHYTYPASSGPELGRKLDRLFHRYEDRPRDAGGGVGRLCDDTAPLSIAATGALCVLSDKDTPLWLSPEVDAPGTRRLLQRQSDVVFAQTASRAAFLAGPWPSLAAALPEARRGAAERPDLSATLIIEAARVTTTPRTNAKGFLLSGPGVPPEAPKEIWIEGVDNRLSALMAENARAFPLGVDVLVAAGARIVGLPRSIRAIALRRPGRALSA